MKAKGRPLTYEQLQLQMQMQKQLDRLGPNTEIDRVTFAHELRSFLGPAIRLLRIRAALTQTDAISKLRSIGVEMTQSGLSKAENGDSEITASQLDGLCCVYSTNAAILHEVLGSLRTNSRLSKSAVIRALVAECKKAAKNIRESNRHETK